jgi:hypothetical protein
MVILNIGRDIGVISPSLFPMCIIVALVTTAMTSPLLDMLGKDAPEDDLDASIPSSEPSGT